LDFKELVRRGRHPSGGVDTLHSDSGRNHGFFSNWEENPYAQAAIRGAVAAAVAITVKTVWTIAHPHYRRGNRLRGVLIGATAFALHAIVGLSPIDVLLIAAVAGFILPEPQP
jgi:chromate transporter